MIVANLHKCKLCDCNATGIYIHCKGCRHKLKRQNLCGQCAVNPPRGKSLYCADCMTTLGKYFLKYIA